MEVAVATSVVDPARVLAKAMFWCGGKLSHVKTPHTTHLIVSFDPFVTEASEKKSWLPCELSMKLLKLSMWLDWDHWDHWALVHSDCDPSPCAVCGGCSCPDDDVDAAL